jgi:hypothetical protein
VRGAVALRAASCFGCGTPHVGGPVTRRTLNPGAQARTYRSMQSVVDAGHSVAMKPSRSTRGFERYPMNVGPFFLILGRLLPTLQ